LSFNHTAKIVQFCISNAKLYYFIKKDELLLSDTKPYQAKLSPKPHPVQVIGNESGLTEGFDNLFIIGEGSGYAGGIMSSAADGIKAALRIAESG